MLLRETWPSMWSSWTGCSRKSGGSLDLGSQKRSGEGTAASGWPAYATLKGQSPCAWTLLLTSLKPYHSAVPDRITITILQKMNSVEGQRGLKNHLRKVLCGQAIFFTLMYLSMKPCSLSFHTVKMKLTLSGHKLNSYRSTFCLVYTLYWFPPDRPGFWSRLQSLSIAKTKFSFIKYT